MALEESADLLLHGVTNMNIYQTKGAPKGTGLTQGAQLAPYLQYGSRYSPELRSSGGLWCLAAACVKELQYVFAAALPQNH